jgi:hypothetical protein
MLGAPLSGSRDFAWKFSKLLKARPQQLGHRHTTDDEAKQQPLFSTGGWGHNMFFPSCCELTRFRNDLCQLHKHNTFHKATPAAFVSVFRLESFELLHMAALNNDILIIFACHDTLFGIVVMLGSGAISLMLQLQLMTKHNGRKTTIYMGGSSLF